MRPTTLQILIVTVGLAAVGCSGAAEAPDLPGSGGSAIGTGGVPSVTGGTSSGGAVASGGATVPGGATGKGGAGNGGSATGGTTQGGALTGGATQLGGAINIGGKATNGGSSSGGSSKGGAAQGGVTATGGTTSTGGKATGGTSVGGTATGGTATGGTATGGTATGGTATGGAGAGGAIIGTGGTRTACSKPAGYRNLFVEILGKTPADVDAKITTAVQQLFHGSSNQTIYYEYGTDQAYVQDIASNDIRSEGQSYGMTVAVQLGMKTEFDKLWNYAVKCMRQPNGLFAWQMNPNSCTAKSTGAAPDGEEYFAMALMLASRRWGDSGAVNYGSEAKKVMSAMLAARPGGEFYTNPNVVSFGPYQDFSDPSYILPLFYSEWACFDTAHAAFWTKATTDGRAFLKKTCNPTTGLAPYQANWDGTPRAGNGTFNADSWRVPMNIMMDFNLNNADTWQTTYAKTNAAFWMKEGLSSYGNGYNLDGTGKTGMHGAGLAAVNATLAFALPAADGKPLLQAAWDTATPTGTYRYYDGTLYMLAMLHLSGKFSLFN